MNWPYLLNGFHGRIGRQTFWIAMIVLTVVELGCHFVAEQIQGDRLSAIVDLAFTYPEFAVALKRAHDRDLPVWLLWIFFGAGAVLDLFTVLGLAGSDENSEHVVARDRRAVRGVRACAFGRARFPPGNGRSQSIRAGSAGDPLTAGDYALTLRRRGLHVAAAAANPYRRNEVDRIFRQF